MVELFEKNRRADNRQSPKMATEELTRDATEIYRLYGLDIKPKWFPVLYMLYDGGDSTITAIAKAIGQHYCSGNEGGGTCQRCKEQ